MGREPVSGLLAGLLQRLVDYLPTLAVGGLLLVVGIAAGWVAKRAIVRILVWLRLDRLAGRVGWRAMFGKGDARAALYDVLGGIAMALVMLVFLDNALQILGLTVLSQMVDHLVFYLPNLGFVAVIVGVGMLLANLVAARAEDILAEEGFERARLVAQMLKGWLLALVGAIALWQLQLAREIVLAAFVITFGAIGLAFAMAMGLGSAKAIQRGWDILFEKRKRE